MVRISSEVLKGQCHEDFAVLGQFWTYFEALLVNKILL